jgi:hypothetical protein
MLRTSSTERIPTITLSNKSNGIARVQSAVYFTDEYYQSKLA